MGLATYNNTKREYIGRLVTRPRACASGLRRIQLLTCLPTMWYPRGTYAASSISVSWTCSITIPCGVLLLLDQDIVRLDICSALAATEGRHAQKRVSLPVWTMF